MSKMDIELSKITNEMNLSSNGNDEASANSNQENDSPISLPFPLLQLPERPQRILLQYLNAWCLMDLRLASKGTKKMVDEFCLDKLSLHILNHGQMEEEAFKNSTTPWRAVVIRSDSLNNDTSWISNALYSTLLNKLSTTLSSLKLAEHRLPYLGLRSILCTCQVLKRIDIGTLWCGDWSQDEDTYSKSNEYKNLIISFGKLETLRIAFLAWNKEEDLGVFNYILSKCSNIIFLKVPHILMANFMQNDDEDEEVTDRRYLNLLNTTIVEPLLELINKPKRKRSTLPTYLDVKNMHHSEIFPRIVQACSNTGMKLLNVSEAYETPTEHEDLECLQAIESLSGFTQYLNFDRLLNLKSITLDSETSADSDVNENYITTPLSSLKSLSFFLPDDISPNLLTFLKHRRAGVTELCIKFQVQEPILSQLFAMSVLVKSYNQVQHLSLIHWGGIDDDLVLILKSLTSLVSFRMDCCPKITDRGFLGPNPTEPVLLNLKDLKDLWIDCQISNAVLKYAIRHIKLESLFYSSEWVTLPGFLSLTQGVLSTTLICFPVAPPENCTAEILERFLSYFKNLKRKPLFGSIHVEGNVGPNGFQFDNY